MTFLVVALFALGGLGFVGYLIFDFKKGLSSTYSIIERDLESLIESLKSIELSHWDLEELNLISRVGDSEVTRSLYGEIEQGVIYSIYQEPILGFAVKTYSNNQNKLYTFKWNDSSFSLFYEDDQLKINKNQSLFGTILLDDKLILSNTTNDKVVIDIHSKSSLIPVLHNDKEIISINSDDNEEIDHSRVLNEIHQSDNSVKELFIVGLGYAIVEHLI